LHICIAVATKVDGVWQKKTFKEYYDDVIAAAKSLIEVCLEVNCSVGIAAIVFII